MLDLGIFGLKLGNNIAIFEINTFKFLYLQHISEKQKFLNLGPNMRYLDSFGLEFENNTVIFEISTLAFVKF